MKNKYKIMIFFGILLLVIIPMISLFGQSGNYFVDSTFVRGSASDPQALYNSNNENYPNMIAVANQFDNNAFELTEPVVSKATKDIENGFTVADVIFKMQTEVKVKKDEYYGKTFTALFIDNDGIFDLGEKFVLSSGEGNPVITEDYTELQTFYGTKSGKHYVIGVLSDEVPYFGNIYISRGTNPGNSRVHDRYIRHFADELERVGASVYVTEFNVSYPEKSSKKINLQSVLGKDFTQDLLNKAGGLSNSAISLKDNMAPAEDTGTIGGNPKVWELYVSIETEDEALFGHNGLWLAGLYIDSSGMYDIANGTFFDDKHLITESKLDERFIIEGTQTNEFVLVLTLSNQEPYFGDFLRESHNADDTLGKRYVENVIEELEEQEAFVYVLKHNPSVELSETE